MCVWCLTKNDHIINIEMGSRKFYQHFIHHTLKTGRHILKIKKTFELELSQLDSDGLL
jgi:hypothetical protein